MRQQSIRWWIFDLASPGLLQLMSTSMGTHLTNAAMKFAPANGVAFFESLGWRAPEIQSFFRAAARLRRLPLALRPSPCFPIRTRDIRATRDGPRWFGRRRTND
jgi:hypothetical protein